MSSAVFFSTINNYANRLRNYNTTLQRNNDRATPPCAVFATETISHT